VLFAADVGAVKCRIPTSALGFAARASLHSGRPYRSRPPARPPLHTRLPLLCPSRTRRL
jgi:hypothetical protein